MRRLLEFALKDKVRYLQRQGGIDQTLCLQYAPVDRAEQLRADFAFAVTWAVVAESGSVRDAEAFAALVAAARPKLLPLAADVLPVLGEILERYHELRRVLYGADLEALFPGAWADLDGQLGYLVYPGFLTEVPLARLRHYPRYLAAMQYRIERLEFDPAADASRQERVEGFWRDYLARVAALEDYPETLDGFHWLLEEYRVSLFHQQLGTAEKVSAKRLAAAWAEVPEP